VGNCLCLGVDPDPQALPPGLTTDLRGVEGFGRTLLDHALEQAAAVKFNLAFFEAFGSAGMAALERLRAQVPPAIPVIADAKRGDISATVARQAVALFDALGADAVTASPYLGADALEPLIEREDRFVYVLCRTSNPGAADLQDLSIDGQPLYLHVARQVAGWSEKRPRLGLVVGATAPQELARIRHAAPGLPLLVPGVGSQGGAVAPVLEHGPATAAPGKQVGGGGLLVNVSRGIAGAALNAPSPAAAGKAVAAAAAAWAQRLRV
jgi:orotidine-5'-phosphate decarboxylase